MFLENEKERRGAKRSDRERTSSDQLESRSQSLPFAPCCRSFSLLIAPYRSLKALASLLFAPFRSHRNVRGQTIYVRTLKVRFFLSRSVTVCQIQGFLTGEQNCWNVRTFRIITYVRLPGTGRSRKTPKNMTKRDKMCHNLDPRTESREGRFAPPRPGTRLIQMRKRDWVVNP